MCENYTPPEGFDPKDLYKLLEKASDPNDDLGNVYSSLLSLSLGQHIYLLLLYVLTLWLCVIDCCSAWFEGVNKLYIPFLACGDLSGYDADQSYPLPKVGNGSSSYESLKPIQPPIAPPYKTAIELEKKIQSKKGWSQYRKEETPL